MVRNADQPEMNADMIQALVANAVGIALADQEQRLRSVFASELESVRIQVSALTVQAPQAEVKRLVPNPDIRCEVKLDIVTTLPSTSARGRKQH